MLGLSSRRRDGSSRGALGAAAPSGRHAAHFACPPLCFNFANLELDFSNNFPILLRNFFFNLGTSIRMNNILSVIFMNNTESLIIFKTKTISKPFSCIKHPAPTINL